MVMCTRNIRFLRKGDKGDKGDRGRLPVPYGEYVAGTAYTATDLIAPYVLCEGQYYVMNKTTTWQQSSRTPKQDYAQYGSNATWILLERYKAIFVELLMASFGKIASAIFYENLMFSQQGKINGAASSNYEALHTDTAGDVRENSGDFIPNFWINFLNGKMKAISSEIRDGKFVNADVESGKIGGFSLSDGWLEAEGTDYGALLSAATIKLFANAFDLGDGRITSNFEVHPYAAAYSYFYIMERLVSAITPESGASDYSASNRANILMYLSATGQKLPTYGSSGQPYGGNFVAWCEGGMFAGLRPHLRHISSSTVLAATDNVIVVNNSSALTLTLPHNAEIGQEYEIWHTSSTSLTIQTQNYSTRKYIYRLTKTAGFSYSVESGSQEIMRFKFTPGLYNSSSYEKGCWLMVYYGKSA